MEGRDIPAFSILYVLNFLTCLCDGRRNILQFLKT